MPYQIIQKRLIRGGDGMSEPNRAVIPYKYGLPLTNRTIAPAAISTPAPVINAEMEQPHANRRIPRATDERHVFKDICKPPFSL